MALPETPAQEKPPNEQPQHNKHEKREKPPTKVIVRRLPPGITTEEFVAQVSPIPDYDYLYSIKGDMSLGENAFSRVYINFCNSDDIYLFKEKFDNYVFVDGKGHEYAAVVEFAAFQKIPKKRGKPRPNPKSGTIESDPIYIEFVESLKRQPAANQEEKVEFSYQLSNENKNEKSTPLLDYIKQRKIDRMKSREEKREERRRKEIERKKLRDEEKKKRFDENSPTKAVTIKQNVETNEIKKTEKPEEKKSGVKPKPKYNQNYEKRDYKSTRSNYNNNNNRHNYKEESTKKATTTTTTEEGKQIGTSKKVKKYSERREERKQEVRKAELKKDVAKEAIVGEESNRQAKAKEKDAVCEEVSKPKEVKEKVPKEDKDRDRDRDRDREDSKGGDQDRVRNKENDPRAQRRIRNKDRPTMQLYQPGMLSKRRQQEDDKDTKDQTKE